MVCCSNGYIKYKMRKMQLWLHAFIYTTGNKSLDPKSTIYGWFTLDRADVHFQYEESNMTKTELTIVIGSFPYPPAFLVDLGLQSNRFKIIKY